MLDDRLEAGELQRSYTPSCKHGRGQANMSAHASRSETPLALKQPTPCLESESANLRTRRGQSTRSSDHTCRPPPSHLPQCTTLLWEDCDASVQKYSPNLPYQHNARALFAPQDARDRALNHQAIKDRHAYQVL
jgi:hypothetical protein